MMTTKNDADDQPSLPKSSERIKPHISVVASDFVRLAKLAEAAMVKMPDVAGWLADELDRARVVHAKHPPLNAVSMGCEVTFRDNKTNLIHTVSLVYPNEADISQKKISVLTPIGVALIGMSTGQSINWQTRSGELRDLTVIDVNAKLDG
jgi:regulator of nucleoside diphosphate kinase